MSTEVASQQSRRPDDGPAIIAGIVVTLAIHLLPLVLWFAVQLSTCWWRPCLCRWERLRPSALRCAVAHANNEAQPQHEEEIIEGALLRLGGGGVFDPRTIHRRAPVRSEERAQDFAGRNPSQDSTPRDAGTRRDPSALLTERDVRGEGNQDLAERIRRMAESEQASDPSAPPGPGAPEGSVNGTETDPTRAGTGAWAKVRSFLQNQLHLLATAPSTARRTFRLRVVISDDGASIARGQIVQGSGDETTDADLLVQLQQLAENHTPIPELTDEERIAIRGQSRLVRYDPD